MIFHPFESPWRANATANGSAQVLLITVDRRNLTKTVGRRSRSSGHRRPSSIAVNAIDLDVPCMFQSLVIPEKFQHILRILSTNIDGKRKVMFAMTAIKGIGRRFSNIVLKKADVDLNKRAGECTDEEVCIVY